MRLFSREKSIKTKILLILLILVSIALIIAFYWTSNTFYIGDEGYDKPQKEKTLSKSMSKPLSDLTLKRGNFVKIHGKTFQIPKNLQLVAECESNMNHFENGNVLRGTNPADVGLFQINISVWEDKAESLGYDIYSLEGNIKMAKWIYKNHGIKEWRYSGHCWQDKI